MIGGLVEHSGKPRHKESRPQNRGRELGVCVVWALMREITFLSFDNLCCFPNYHKPGNLPPLLWKLKVPVKVWVGPGLAPLPGLVAPRPLAPGSSRAPASPPLPLQGHRGVQALPAPYRCFPPSPELHLRRPFV